MSSYYLKKEECIMCGLCQRKAPTCIDYDDNSIVCWKNTDQEEYLPTKEEEQPLANAAKCCPTHAIRQRKN